MGAGVLLGAASLREAITALQPRLFYSSDVADTLAGQPVVVEVGDGQVADFGNRVVRLLAEANVIR